MHTHKQTQLVHREKKKSYTTLKPVITLIPPSFSYIFILPFLNLPLSPPSHSFTSSSSSFLPFPSSSAFPFHPFLLLRVLSPLLPSLGTSSLFLLISPLSPFFLPPCLPLSSFSSLLSPAVPSPSPFILPPLWRPILLARGSLETDGT